MYIIILILLFRCKYCRKPDNIAELYFLTFEDKKAYKVIIYIYIYYIYMYIYIIYIYIYIYIRLF